MQPLTCRVPWPDVLGFLAHRREYRKLIRKPPCPISCRARSNAPAREIPALNPCAGLLPQFDFAAFVLIASCVTFSFFFISNTESLSSPRTVALVGQPANRSSRSDPAPRPSYTAHQENAGHLASLQTPRLRAVQPPDRHLEPNENSHSQQHPEEHSRAESQQLFPHQSFQPPA